MAGGTTDFFSSKHKKLFWLSTLANILAWIILIVYLLIMLGNAYEYFALLDELDYPQQTHLIILFGLVDIMVMFFTRVIATAIPGVVAWLVLKGISLGLKMIVETDINYREIRVEASMRGSAQEEASNEQIEELADEENKPVFYDSSAVLNIKEWLERIGFIAIFVFIVNNFQRLSYYQAVVDRYFPNTPTSELLTWMIAIGIVALVTALQSLITYFSLRALASILAILMEMEYTSRGITR